MARGDCKLLQYFSTMAPVLIGNHLLVGSGNDLDEAGYVESVDPDTGDMQLRFHTVPMKAGDPSRDTWRNLDAASHGGNPSAAYTSQMRGPGANLFTCSLIAVNVDTGKPARHS
jgi:alcohol dehydrogenase (cytochrome c)